MAKFRPTTKVAWQAIGFAAAAAGVQFRPEETLNGTCWTARRNYRRFELTSDTYGANFTVYVRKYRGVWIATAIEVSLDSEKFYLYRLKWDENLTQITEAFRYYISSDLHTRVAEWEIWNEKIYDYIGDSK